MTRYEDEKFYNTLKDIWWARMQKMTGIEVAVELAGNKNMLAFMLDVTRRSIDLWIDRGWVPPLRAMQIEKLFGISSSKLLKPEFAIILDFTQLEPTPWRA